MDFDPFCKFKGETNDNFLESQEELEKPYTIADVTAKDATVMGNIEKALDIDPQDESRGDLTYYYYEELVEKIMSVD